MLKLFTLALLFGAAPAPPALAPCHVTVTSRPAPGLSVEFIGLPFRILTVRAERGCSFARVALSNYGGRYYGAPCKLQAGRTVRLGPVPLYRKILWFSESGVSYEIPITRGVP